MIEAVTIKRRKSADSDVSFDSLKNQGFSLAQQFSGQQWTDYNLHDPGVTILEQLIYAITDLVYRTEFDVEDCLSREDGSIDLDYQALHAPEKVLPCRPTTVLDYRKAILNAVSEVDNVWLTPAVACADKQSYLGLYDIHVKLEQGLAQEFIAAAMDKIYHVYAGARNLCEDVANISLVENVDYELCCYVEVSTARRPADILAEIYFECSRRLASGIAIHNFDHDEYRKKPLDEVFSGPFTNHGLFRDEDFSANQAEFVVSNLFTVINAIQGVEQITKLCLEKDGECFYDSIECNSPEQAFCLSIPESSEQIKVVLSANGRTLPVSLDDMKAKYNEMNFKYHSLRSTLQDLSQLYQTPRGVLRPLAMYYSIQNQFPAVYAINAYGVPESAAPDVKARARQLKSYLVIFEQLLANYLANLASIKTLFSVEREQRSTYSTAVLDPKQIADLESVYPDNPLETFGRIIEKFDNYTDRKNRLLDYLLALYGESFTQNSLRHFNYYYSKDDVEQTIIDNKIDYLQSIIKLGQDRAAAPNYSGASWHERALSGLQRRVSLLLGFERRAARPLTMSIFKQGIKLTRHSVYAHLKAGSQELKFIDIHKMSEAGRQSFENVPEHELPETISLNQLRQQIGDAIPLKNNLLSDDLLRGGIYIDRYSVGSLTANQDYQLTYRTGDDQHWYLGTYPDRDKGIIAANALCHLFRQLNIDSEGLHILEHILLRPMEQDQHADLVLPPDEDFYSFKISVIFPAWTARCHDEQFRLLAEETVRLNAPAHVFPEFCWLEFHKMYEFEILYEKWLAIKARKQPSSAELNHAASKLIAFLLEQRKTRAAEC